jgi:hypothetical protein
MRDKLIDEVGHAVTFRLNACLSQAPCKIAYKMHPWWPDGMAYCRTGGALYRLPNTAYPLTHRLLAALKPSALNPVVPGAPDNRRADYWFACSGRGVTPLPHLPAVPRRLRGGRQRAGGLRWAAVIWSTPPVPEGGADIQALDTIWHSAAVTLLDDRGRPIPGSGWSPQKPWRVGDMVCLQPFILDSGLESPP